jgi:hypothetical protein
MNAYCVQAVYLKTKKKKKKKASLVRLTLEPPKTNVQMNLKMQMVIIKKVEAEHFLTKFL